MFKPLLNAIDSFFASVPTQTRRAPHIRDAVDVKRWMILVVIALFPCILVAIWNAGIQSVVYSSGDYKLMDAYLEASKSWGGYWSFASMHASAILYEGLSIFLPLVFISYAVGGFWEALFAILRKHEIAEGFLVSGILYPLILPPTIPYWMAAAGISAGIVIGKELFGGTGMNILNPALTCRCFLYFAFPAYMTGEVWAGKNLWTVKTSLLKMNQAAGLSPIDGYSQPSALSLFHASSDVKRIHIDAIALNDFHEPVLTGDLIQSQFQKWNGGVNSLGSLSDELLQKFSTAPIDAGGLGLSSDGF